MSRRQPVWTVRGPATDLRQQQQLQRLGTEDIPLAVTPALTPEHGISEASGSGAPEYDGRRPADHRPTTQCVMAVDASEALERVSEGVSGYIVTPPAFHQEAPPSCNRQSVRTPPLSSSVVSVPVTSSLTADRWPCEVVKLVDCTAPAAETICADDSRLHSAMQARCTQLLRQNYSYHDIEKQLLQHGMNR